MMRRRLWSLLLALGLVSVSVASAEDAVILMDGFTIRGKSFKENAVNFDVLSGPLVFTRLNAFDGVDQGAKYVFYSGHTKKQLAAIEKDIPSETTLEFSRPNPGSLNRRLPGLAEMKIGEFKDNWRRQIDVRMPDGKFEQIDQQVTYLSPSRMYVASVTHSWRQAYATKELDPAVVRKLLSTHPKLMDEKGKVDPMRRLTIAEFLKEVGWIRPARDELTKLKKDAPGNWTKEAEERYDKISAEIDRLETRLVIEELEASLNSGRYQEAARFLEQYKPKAPEAKDLAKIGEIKARLEILTPRYENCKRLLRDLIDELTGKVDDYRMAAVASTGILPALPPKMIPADIKTLTTAAETVLLELHPDSVSRVEFFLDLAAQDEKLKAAGMAPIQKPEKLLARAVSGWLKGKNGAEEDVKNAIRCWNTRLMAVRFLLEEGEANRFRMLNDYLGSPDNLAPDEIAQVMSIMPPINAENLSAIRGTKIEPKLTQGIDNIYRCKSGTAPIDGDVRYALRLPNEYHHGRSYPLIVGIPTPGMEAEKLVAGLSVDASRLGYITTALEWGDRIGNKGYNYSGNDHAQIMALIRDVSRRFQVDPDKIFLFGFGEGANFALDLGISHPDHFAGVVAMSPSILPQFYQDYWRNAQKLPVYTVVGEMSGPAFENLRKVYEKWLPLGYPGILSVYKGRGNEWFANEIPTAFDWMSRKTRVRGTASLRLNATRFDPWQCMRESDKRFYWVEFTDIAPVNTMRPDRPNAPPFPAQFRADIRKGNEIVVEEIRGVRKIALWLERDMIDWDKEVVVKIASKVPWKPKKLQPDLWIMFDHLYRTGDRKMLYFGRLEFDMVPN